VATESGRTVVIDANFVGGGTFRSQKFDQLVDRLAARGHAVVVPEVVVWEWAQHTHEALTAAQREGTRARRASDPALGVAVPPLDVPPVTEIAGRIRAHIAAVPSAAVATTDPEGAVDAIAQQVMQTGTGSRSKDGTKTGAPDALIVRTVEIELESAEQVVVATGDQHLAEVVGELEEDVVIVRDQRDLWLWHGPTPPPSDELLSAVESFVEGNLTKGLDERHAFALFDQGVILDSSIFDNAGFHTDDVRQKDVEIE
jgi:hypothetical protein